MFIGAPGEGKNKNRHPKEGICVRDGPGSPTGSWTGHAVGCGPVLAQLQQPSWGDPSVPSTALIQPVPESQGPSMEVCSSPSPPGILHVGATIHGDALLEQDLAVVLGTSMGARVVILREEEGEEGSAE